MAAPLTPLPQLPEPAPPTPSTRWECGDGCLFTLSMLLISLLALGFGLLCTKWLAERRRSKLPAQQQPVVQLGLPMVMTYDAVQGRCLRTPAPLSAPPQPQPQPQSQPQQEEMREKHEGRRQESEAVEEWKEANEQEEQRGSLHEDEEERLERRAASSGSLASQQHKSRW